MKLIVIGGGAAGLSAAAQAAELGAQVTVLEVNPKLGGNGMFAEVLFALNGPYQRAQGIKNDLDGFFRLAMEHSHWKNNARLVRRMLEASGENLDWLCKHGLNIAGMEPESVPGLGQCTHFTADMHTGKAVMDILRDFCETHGAITIHTKTRVTELTVTDGRVTGVTAERDGELLHLDADAVVLACGGFSGNMDLIGRIIPGVDPSAFAHLRGVRMQGEGILLAEAAGAEILSDGCFENAGPTFAGNQALMGLVTKRYALWLNQQGRRFADESVGDNFVYGCNAVYAQPGHKCYVLLDSAMVQKAAVGPVDFLAGPEAVKKGMAGLETALNQEMETGNALRAGTLEEVAAWMGAPIENLRREIADYNGYCAAGADPVFLKPAELLQPVQEPPYVCIRCGVDYILTHGGIRVDEEMRVLRETGAYIPGLYAAGADISGVDAGGYQVTMGGHSFGFALTGGRLAAGSAVENS